MFNHLTTSPGAARLAAAAVATVTLAVAFATPPAPAAADVLYSTFPTNGAAANGAIGSDVDFDSVVYGSFTLDSAADVETIDVTANFNGPFPSAATFEVGVYANVDDPDFPIGEAAFVQTLTLTSFPTGGVYRELELDIADTGLAAGDYWLNVQTLDAGAPDFFWAGPGVRGRSYYFSNVTETGRFDDARRRLFAINGSAIPEPASLAALGLAGLALRRRR